MQHQCILSSSTWVFIPCRELFILHLAGLEGGFAGFAVGSSSAGCPWQAVFSCSHKAGKDTKETFQNFHGGNEKKLVLCDVKMSWKNQKPQLLGQEETVTPGAEGRVRAESPIPVWAAP